MHNINLISFGTRHRKMETVEADHYFDCFHLANPHNTNMKNLNGLDNTVQAWVFHYSNFHAWDMIEDVADLIHTQTEDITIAFQCIGGKHRSVSVVERLAADLRRNIDPSIRINIQHMEINNDL